MSTKVCPWPRRSFTQLYTTCSSSPLIFQLLCSLLIFSSSPLSPPLPFSCLWVTAAGSCSQTVQSFFVSALVTLQQVRVFARPHACMCWWPMRLDLLTVECMCVLVCVGRQASWLSVSSYWWMKRWAWFPRSPGQLWEQAIISPWPWRPCRLLSMHSPHFTFWTDMI